jgi:hypothetical protein
MKATITCEYDVKGATYDGKKCASSGELQRNIDVAEPLEELEIFTVMLEMAFSRFWTREGEKQCHSPFRDISISLRKIRLE